MTAFRPPITRRRFIATSAMAAVAAAIPVVEAEAEDDVRVTRLPVFVPNLPAALAGITIAHVTDLHIYETEPHPAARRALVILERERPDLLVVTGDQWDHRAGVRGYEAWLRARPKGLPAVAVLGNHEYALGRGTPLDIARAARKVHARGEAELLVNETRLIPLRGSHLRVFGLDDLRHGDPRPDVFEPLLDPAEPQLWLFHEPGQADRPGWPRAAVPCLMLAGHTHGGQIRLPLVPAVTPSGSGRYVAGLYATSLGPLYVSRGVGASGPRLRYRCPAEVALFELRPATLESGPPLG
ncbi:MAG TPA: metallophosphoesterase [Gemmatimonadales bacterium]|nr:metallophosphoesterase [Gemmatimonadales bacterium]